MAREGTGAASAASLSPEVQRMLAGSHRYCPCERERPYRDPDWDIGPERGYCRVCGCEIHPRDIRRLHAIATAELVWQDAKGRSAHELLANDA